MKIIRGHTRIVVIIGSLAFKFAVIHPYYAVKAICRPLKYTLKWLLFMTPTRKIPRYFRGYFWNYYYDGTPAAYLFSGIMANIHERRLFRETNNPFLMSTFFSLFGLVNVQKVGYILDMDPIDCWFQIVGLSSMNDAFCDSHCFMEPTNFCWVDGHLKIIDYGNRDCHEFLMKYGQKLYDEFSLDYSREEEKKRSWPEKSA